MKKKGEATDCFFCLSLGVNASRGDAPWSSPERMLPPLLISQEDAPSPSHLPRGCSLLFSSRIRTWKSYVFLITSRAGNVCRVCKSKCDSEDVRLLKSHSLFNSVKRQGDLRDFFNATSLLLPRRSVFNHFFMSFCRNYFSFVETVRYQNHEVSSCR